MIALARAAVTRLRFGGRRFSCPLCGGSFRRMKPFLGTYWILGRQVDHATPNSICPGCGSDLRHRLVLAFLASETALFRSPLRVLHFAPEHAMAAALKSRPGIDYVAGDLEPENYPGAIRLDITQLDLPDASFDAVLAIHVLEHIREEARAFREIHRVLKPGGWALLAVPTYGATTIDTPGLDDEGRIRAYGRADHVRLNGLDFAERLRAAGFDVTVRSLEDVPGNWVDRSARSPHVDSDRHLFFARKSG